MMSFPLLHCTTQVMAIMRKYLPLINIHWTEKKHPSWILAHSNRVWWRLVTVYRLTWVGNCEHCTYRKDVKAIYNVSTEFCGGLLSKESNKTWFFFCIQKSLPTEFVSYSIYESPKGTASSSLTRSFLTSLVLLNSRRGLAGGVSRPPQPCGNFGRSVTGESSPGTSHV